MAVAAFAASFAWKNLLVVKKMETTIMENQVEKKMENEMETTIMGLYRV